MTFPQTTFFIFTKNILNIFLFPNPWCSLPLVSHTAHLLPFLLGHLFFLYLLWGAKCLNCVYAITYTYRTHQWHICFFRASYHHTTQPSKMYVNLWPSPNPPELFPVGPRSVGISVGGTTNWLSNMIVGLTFPFIQTLMGEFSFILFITSSCVLGSFLYRCVDRLDRLSLADFSLVYDRQSFKCLGSGALIYRWMDCLVWLMRFLLAFMKL